MICQYSFGISETPQHQNCINSAVIPYQKKSKQVQIFIFDLIIKINFK